MSARLLPDGLVVVERQLVPRDLVLVRPLLDDEEAVAGKDPHQGSSRLSGDAQGLEIPRFNRSGRREPGLAPDGDRHHTRPQAIRVVDVFAVSPHGNAADAA